jgi:hypothetical protein
MFDDKEISQQNKENRESNLYPTDQSNPGGRTPPPQSPLSQSVDLEAPDMPPATGSSGIAAGVSAVFM